MPGDALSLPEPTALAHLAVADLGVSDMAGDKLRVGVIFGSRSVEHEVSVVTALQVIAALGLIIIGAVAFVGSVEQVAHALGVDEILLALVVAPIATELPEKFNSIIWVRQGKDTLAMGNITGAMVFQASIPTVVALVLAPGAWVAGPGTYTAFASAGIAFVSSAAIFLPMARTGRLRGRGLLVGGIFYVAYLALVLAVVLNPG